MNPKRVIVLVSAVLVPVIAVSGCSGIKSTKVKGTFPVCHSSRTSQGVIVSDTNDTPCVVKDAAGVYTILPDRSRSPLFKTQSPSAKSTTK